MSDQRSRRKTRGRSYQGISLRDYFAAQALPGLMALVAAGLLGEGESSATLAGHASDCYAVADAMLREREKR